MLNGSLESFALSEVLRFVAASGATGRVEIEREEVSGELSLDQGRFVAARLADEDAPATEDEALDVAVLLFDGSAGTFTVVDEEWAGGPLSLDADELVRAVDRRRQQWAEVVQVLGSLDDPLSLVADLPEGAQEVTITAQQWGLLTLIDGVRSAQDIARDARQSVYGAALALAGLAEMGMVSRSDVAGSSGTSSPDEDPAEMLRELGEGEESPKAKRRATVRPLRVPTREEQRVRLRR